MVDENPDRNRPLSMTRRVRPSLSKRHASIDQGAPGRGNASLRADAMRQGCRVSDRFGQKRRDSSLMRHEVRGRRPPPIARKGWRRGDFMAHAQAAGRGVARGMGLAFH